MPVPASAWLGATCVTRGGEEGRNRPVWSRCRQYPSRRSRPTTAPCSRLRATGFWRFGPAGIVVGRWSNRPGCAATASSARAASAGRSGRSSPIVPLTPRGFSPRSPRWLLASPSFSTSRRPTPRPWHWLHAMTCAPASRRRGCTRAACRRCRAHGCSALPRSNSAETARSRLAEYALRQKDKQQDEEREDDDVAIGGEEIARREALDERDDEAAGNRALDVPNPADDGRRDRLQSHHHAHDVVDAAVIGRGDQAARCGEGAAEAERIGDHAVDIEAE